LGWQGHCVGVQLCISFHLLIYHRRALSQRGCIPMPCIASCHHLIMPSCYHMSPCYVMSYMLSRRVCHHIAPCHHAILLLLARSYPQYILTCATLYLTRPQLDKWTAAELPFAFCAKCLCRPTSRSSLQPPAALLRLATNMLGQIPQITEDQRLQEQLLQSTLDFVVSLQRIHQRADKVCISMTHSCIHTQSEMLSCITLVSTGADGITMYSACINITDTHTAWNGMRSTLHSKQCCSCCTSICRHLFSQSATERFPSDVFSKGLTRCPAPAFTSVCDPWQPGGRCQQPGKH
jgi:hypothetical protein